MSSRSIMSSPSVQRKENHYSKREVDELDEQKVNFKSQPNKEKSYLRILPVRPPFERRESSRDRVSVRWDLSVSLEPASESSSDSEDSDRSRRRRVPPRDLVYTWYDLLARSCRWSCSLKERPVRSISEKSSSRLPFFSFNKEVS